MFNSRLDQYLCSHAFFGDASKMACVLVVGQSTVLVVGHTNFDIRSHI